MNELPGEEEAGWAPATRRPGQQSTPAGTLFRNERQHLGLFEGWESCLPYLLETVNQKLRGTGWKTEGRSWDRTLTQMDNRAPPSAGSAAPGTACPALQPCSQPFLPRWQPSRTGGRGALGRGPGTFFMWGQGTGPPGYSPEPSLPRNPPL